MKIDSAEFVKGAVDWEGMPTRDWPEVAFVGRSNVGKSSLINMLVHRKKLAYTSKKPGKTREFNFYLINNRFYFVDLPGFGYAQVSKEEQKAWADFIEQYLNQRLPLRAIIHLVDSRHPPTDQDEDVMVFMRGHRVPYIVALSKTDKLSNNQRAQSVARVEKKLREVGLEVPVVATSAKTGRGKNELWSEIGPYLD